MTGCHTIQAYCFKKKLFHGPQRFRHNALSPPCLPQAVPDVSGFCSLVQLDHGNIADNTVRLFPYDGPVKVGAVFVTRDPVVQDIAGDVHACMCRPGQKICYFRIRCPVFIHIRSISDSKFSEKQPMCFYVLCSCLIHNTYPPLFHKSFSSRYIHRTLTVSA